MKDQVCKLCRHEYSLEETTEPGLCPLCYGEGVNKFGSPRDFFAADWGNYLTGCHFLTMEERNVDELIRFLRFNYVIFARVWDTAASLTNSITDDTKRLKLMIVFLAKWLTGTGNGMGQVPNIGGRVMSNAAKFWAEALRGGETYQTMREFASLGLSRDSESNHTAETVKPHERAAHEREAANEWCFRDAEGNVIDNLGPIDPLNHEMWSEFGKRLGKAAAAERERIVLEALEKGFFRGDAKEGVCPNCGRGEFLELTTQGGFPNENRAACPCGWHGRQGDLIDDPHENATAEDITKLEGILNRDIQAKVDAGEMALGRITETFVNTEPEKKTDFIIDDPTKGENDESSLD